MLQGLEVEQKMKLLLAAADDKCTPLHLACIGGHAEVVSLVLQDLPAPQALRMLQLENGCQFGSPVSVAVFLCHWDKLAAALAKVGFKWSDLKKMENTRR